MQFQNFKTFYSSQIVEKCILADFMRIVCQELLEQMPSNFKSVQRHCQRLRKKCHVVAVKSLSDIRKNEHFRAKNIIMAPLSFDLVLLGTNRNFVNGLIRVKRGCFKGT